MAFKNIMFTVLLVLSVTFAGTVSATRSLGSADLTSRLQAGTTTNGSNAGYWDCWNALTEIRSCSNEIVSFFLTGKADISQPCCNSISIITHHCWPNMLASLGFTPEEGLVLSGFCDHKAGAPPSIAPAAAPDQQDLSNSD